MSLWANCLDYYAMFCGFYRARSSRRNSRDRIVSKAASAHSSIARMARVISEGTDTATGMSPQQRIATTNLETLTLPTSRSEEHTSELQSRQYLVCRLL